MRNVVLITVAIAVDLICLVCLFVLRRRGVYIKIRTMFGPALVFDSQDDDGVPIRLLNVGG